MFRNNHVRLIGAGQKRYFKIHTFGSNSPPHPGKVKFPTPGMAFQIKFPTPRAKKTFKCPGFARGGMLTFRIDRRISVSKTIGLAVLQLCCEMVAVA